MILAVHVYAAARWQAVEWLCAQGLDPRQCTTTGNRTVHRLTHRFRPGDRVVVLGEISTHAEYDLRLRSFSHEPAVERLAVVSMVRPGRGRVDLVDTEEL